MALSASSASTTSKPPSLIISAALIRDRNSSSTISTTGRPGTVAATRSPGCGQSDCSVSLVVKIVRSVASRTLTSIAASRPSGVASLNTDAKKPMASLRIASGSARSVPMVST